jgi:hypothetical protein
MATPRRPVAPAQAPAQTPVAPPTDAHAQVNVQAAAQPARAPLIPGRAVALNRQGVPVQRAGAEAGVDQFWIPPHLLKRFHDEGFDVEWKEHTIHGQHRADVAARQRQVGWEPVMTESYPGVFAPEFDINGQPNRGPIIRGGLMLMERPMPLSLEAKRDEKRKADDKVRGAKQQYNRLDTGGAPTAEYDLTAQRASYIRENVERVDIPQGASFQPPVD